MGSVHVSTILFCKYIIHLQLVPIDHESMHWTLFQLLPRNCSLFLYLLMYKSSIQNKTSLLPMEKVKFQCLQKSADLNSFYPSTSLVHLSSSHMHGLGTKVMYVHEQELSMLS